MGTNIFCCMKSVQPQQTNSILVKCQPVRKINKLKRKNRQKHYFICFLLISNMHVFFFFCAPMFSLIELSDYNIKSIIIQTKTCEPIG